MKISILRMMALAVLAVGLSAAAADNEKEYRKLLSRIDVPAEALTLPADTTASAFWNIALGWDADFTRFQNDIAKGKGLERQALDLYSELQRFYPDYSTLIVREYDDKLDSIARSVGVATDSVSVHLIRCVHPLVFSALTDRGFAILIPTALMGRPGINDDIVGAYIAREYAHCALRHRLQALYKDCKSERRARIGRGFAIAGAVALVTAAAIVDDGSNDVYVYNRMTQNVTVENSGPEPQPLALTYGFDFDTDQIFQADLWAWRAMDRQGKGDAYMRSLMLISADGADPRLYSNWPTTMQRLNFLNYASGN